MSTQATTNPPDLRTGVPRSPNESLGHYVLLPRIIDKCRALIAGTHGDYNYNCPLDRQFFDWAEVDADQLKARLEAGASDEEVLSWVQANSKQRSDAEILAWSYRMRWRRPEGEQMEGYFESLRMEIAPHDYRIETWFQLLDVDEKRF